MKKAKYVTAIIMLVLMSVLTGCGGNLRKSAYTGNVVSCTYHYGSYFGGYYEYHLTLSDDSCILAAMGYNDVDLDVSGTVDASALLRLNEIIQEHSLHKWDGFNESDDNVCDGYGFYLGVEFDDERTLNASGYMMYPKNYQEAHAALAVFFEGLTSEATFAM